MIKGLLHQKMKAFSGADLLASSMAAVFREL